MSWKLVATLVKTRTSYFDTAKQLFSVQDQYERKEHLVRHSVRATMRAFETLAMQKFVYIQKTERGNESQ